MAYQQSVHAARHLLTVGIEEATTRLPRAILSKHWQTNAAGSPAAWRSVEAWLRNQPHYDPHVLATLTHVALMADALACLTSVLHVEPAADVPVNLKLAKMRRQH